MKNKEQLAELYKLETDGDAWTIDTFIAGWEACEKILKKYIEHIAYEEDSTYLNFHNEDTLTKEEFNYLNKLSNGE